MLTAKSEWVEECAGLDAVKDVIKVTTMTLLEEPRAELTALHTLCLMVQAGMVSEVSCTAMALQHATCCRAMHSSLSRAAASTCYLP